MRQRRLDRASDRIRNARHGDDGPAFTPELAFVAALKERLGLDVDPAADFNGGPDEARRVAWSAAADALGLEVDELDQMADAGDPDTVGRLADHLARLRTAFRDAFSGPSIPEAEHSSGAAWDVFDVGAGALQRVLEDELEMRRQQREGQD
ncbi:MAG: hypothetical protein R6U63_13795 [Longimicrobiales bacterium]